MTLSAVEKGALLDNMDAQAPNRVFQEWAAQGHFLPDLKSIQPEYHYGESRLDFALTTEAGCTWWKSRVLPWRKTVLSDFRTRRQNGA